MVAERIIESPEGGGEVLISPAHEGLVLKLAREMVRTEAEAEERAALTDDARRLIPMRLVKMVGDVPRMTAQFEAYLMALPLENPLLTRLKAEQPDLSRRYAAYLGLRRTTEMSARSAQWTLAQQWRVSYSTVRRRIAEAETLIVGYVRAHLAQEIRRRRREERRRQVEALVVEVARRWGYAVRTGPRLDD